MVVNEILVCDKELGYRLFAETLSKAGFVPDRYDLVLIKPNLCGMYHPELQLIEHVIKFFQPLAKRIVIGETDSAGHTPETQFRRLGILNMLDRLDGKVEAINLMKTKILDVEVPNPHVIHCLPIPELVYSCDLLVNIPKIGTHSNTMLTCAFKNLFGLLAEKRKYSVYHPLGVDRVLADVAKVVRCDLTVVDAKDKMVVGVDPLLVDIYGCHVVGLDPLLVEHLQLVAKDRKLNLQNIVNQLQLIKF